ncbi:hypothetical protein SUGI_0555120 [Cryptomeria japonica]|nr:hypothetical protein SUGI_0555120 [Cryptomeria japonica]
MDILQTIYHNAYAQDPYAKEFGLKINDKLASVEARVLLAPWLKYHEVSLYWKRKRMEAAMLLFELQMRNSGRSLSF